MSDSGGEDIEQKELDLSNSDVVTKYKAAADICNRALVAVVEQCKAGARIAEICAQGDAFIVKECAGIFKGKTIEKGVAFPTCISLNNAVGHNSPTLEDTTALKDGDVAKIDMGCHIDGFIAVQAQTIMVQPSFDSEITGRPAEVIECARTAFEAALRLIRPGKKIADVSETLNKIVSAYNCTLVEGVLSHTMKQFVIDGNKCILNRPTPEHKVEDGEFEANEVYAIDIVVSTGEGKPKIKDEKETTVYKRDLGAEYKLRLKASRFVLSEISRRFPAMPFTLRAMRDEDEDKNRELQKQLRLGMVECLSHGLLHPYPVLYEKQGEFVAQIKGTVLLMPNGSDRVTTAVQQPVKTDCTVEDETIVQLLQMSLKSKKKSKRKKGKAANGKANAEEEA